MPPFIRLSANRCIYVHSIGTNKEDDDDNKPPEPTPPPVPVPSPQLETTGNYDNYNGLVYKSLNLIEKETFYSANDWTGGGKGVIQEALDYLKVN